MIKCKKICRHSLKKQLFFRSIALVLLTLLIAIVMNAFFLKDIYIKGKETKLLDAYEIMEKYAANPESSEYQDKLQSICSTFNLSFIIADTETKTIVSSINNTKKLNRILNDVQYSIENDDVIKELKKTENYTICTQKDISEELVYLTIYGKLSNGNFFVIRTAVDDIKYSVKITGTFLLFVSFCSLAFACITSLFVSNHICKPIEKLTNISIRMADLDFNVKYDGKSNSEIGVLGENFNHMSETLEKTINELREANKKLLKDVEQKTLIEKMRTEFISNVSHELKTPIALISGYAEGLKDGINSDPESTEYYLDVIIDETKKMNYMVKELTRLMQLELGDGDFDLDEFDFNQVVNNCLETYKLLFDEKQVNVVTNINKDEVLNIVANEYHIEEVIRNYINNALNHVEGDMRIEVTTKRQDEFAYFSVFNTGKPIPEESLEYIWDKFYKVDKARTRAYGGSGIGLSIVKAISEMSGGKCGVTNKENGVEFWFKIALNKSCP